MPWSAYLVVALFCLLAFPGLGEYGAALVAFGFAFVFMKFAKLLKPVFWLIAKLGYDDDQLIWIGFGLLTLIIVGVALLLVRRLRRPNLTEREHSVAVNGLVLVLGIPLCVAFSFWRLRGLWQ